MQTEIVGYIPNLLYKLYLKLKEKFDNTPPPPEEVIYSLDICEKVVGYEDSKLTYAPMSGKRFIKNENLNIFIVIQNRTINIINHAYSYTIYVEQDDKYNYLLKSFDEALEKQRRDIEDEIRDNIQHSLKRILDRVSDYK